MQKAGLMTLIACLMGVLVASMGYPVWTLEGISAVGLMMAYGFVMSRG